MAGTFKIKEGNLIEIMEIVSDKNEQTIEGFQCAQFLIKWSPRKIVVICGREN
jgi:hypothetical protein